MTHHFSDGVIDLSQFKKERQGTKPFFDGPNIITLSGEDGAIVKYILLANLVIRNKQIIAIESTLPGEEDTIAIVEALIEDDELVGIQAIASEEEYEEMAEIFMNVFEQREAEENPNDGNAET